MTKAKRALVERAGGCVRTAKRLQATSVGSVAAYVAVEADVVQHVEPRHSIGRKIVEEWVPVEGDGNFTVVHHPDLGDESAPVPLIRRIRQQRVELMPDVVLVNLERLGKLGVPHDHLVVLTKPTINLG